MSGRNVLFGSLTVSWLGTAANWAAEAKSILGALAALGSLVASWYAVAAARKKLVGPEIAEVAREERKEREVNAKRKGRKGIKGRKGRERIAVALLAVSLLAGQGCTHATKRMTQARGAFAKQESVLKEESRALTTGVVDALAVAPKSPAIDLAKELAGADQEIEGLPLKRLPVADALSGDTKAAVVIRERVDAIEALRVENTRLASQVRATEERLVAMGVKFEEERNQRVKFWSKWVSFGTVLVGGMVALLVFCPVALPIFGRLLGWVVGKIPALAGALGVVGRDAFDAVLRGVGNARKEFKQRKSGDVGALDNHLRVETDAAHKQLIEVRRAALQV